MQFLTRTKPVVYMPQAEHHCLDIQGPRARVELKFNIIHSVARWRKALDSTYLNLGPGFSDGATKALLQMKNPKVAGGRALVAQLMMANPMGTGEALIHLARIIGAVRPRFVFAYAAPMEFNGKDVDLPRGMDPDESPEVRSLMRHYAKLGFEKFPWEDLQPINGHLIWIPFSSPRMCMKKMNRFIGEQLLGLERNKQFEQGEKHDGAAVAVPFIEPEHQHRFSGLAVARTRKNATQNA